MVRNNTEPACQSDPEPISKRGLETDLGLSVGEP